MHIARTRVHAPRYQRAGEVGATHFRIYLLGRGSVSLCVKGGNRVHRPHDHVHSRMIPIYVRACTRMPAWVWSRTWSSYTRDVAHPGLWGMHSPNRHKRTYTGCFDTNARKVSSVFHLLILWGYDACGDSVGLRLRIRGELSSTKCPGFVRILISRLSLIKFTTVTQINLRETFLKISKVKNNWRSSLSVFVNVRVKD